MVWALVPVDPLSAEDKHYIFNNATFKVGRKGCDVIITKDKGVSRVHAEIVVDDMTFLNPKSNRSSGVRVRDCSKYGTFINNHLGSKQKVHEFPNKEITLNDGDLVSFGTGNATYRFSFVPLIFYICSSAESFQVNHPFQDKVSSIGARISPQLNEECTHVLIANHMSLDNDVVHAVVAKKPVVLLRWVELLAEKNIATEIPSWSPFVPTLKVDGVPVQVVDSVTRANCLKGYACLLEAKDMYKFRDSFPSLLAVAGANVIFAEEFCSNSQSVDYVENFRVLCVIPQSSSDKFGRFSKLSSLSRVNEVDLLCAVISGYLDSSKLVLPTVLVSSSCSTDETIVADSEEEEVETKSVHTVVNICSEESPKYVEKMEINKVELSTVHHSLAKLGESSILSSVENNVAMTSKSKKLEEPETTKSDIIYSQDLIIRDWNLPATTSFTCDNVINFKRFRKKNTVSGNSFNNLIPYAKYPYKNSDCEDQEIIDSVKEEKKRKQMEAMAEDLFNTEKGRGRGTLHSRLSRR
ncbi:nijmegen breakage syndrome 1 [Euphorbia peplus]|nr:nijmegen breakage syndrome 1 [Euphorbia peplus]